jgi:hypothetical protein
MGSIRNIGRTRSGWMGGHTVMTASQENSPDAAQVQQTEPERPAERAGRNFTRKRVLVTTAITIAVCEGLFAFLDARTIHGHTNVAAWGVRRAISLEEARPGRIIRWVPSGEFFNDSDGYLERREYKYEADANGFLKPSAPARQAEVSIIFQGGSTTEIVFVDPELRFANLAGQLIEQATGKKVDTYNAGVSGSYSNDFINALINKIGAFRPNYVVMMENINDLNTLIYNHNSYYGRIRSPIIEIEQKRGRQQRSIIGSALALADAVPAKLVPHVYGRVAGLVAAITGQQEQSDEFAAVRGEQRSVDPDLIRSEYRRNLRLYIQTARLMGATPVLMTQASRFYDESADWKAHIKASIEGRTKVPFEAYRELHHSFNQVIRSVGKTDSVLVIDLEAKIPGRSEFIHDLVHFNANGSKLAARVISDEFVRHYFSN